MVGVPYSVQVPVAAVAQRTTTVVMAVPGVLIPQAGQIITEPQVLMVVSERLVILDAVMVVVGAEVRTAVRRVAEQAVCLAVEVAEVEAQMLTLVMKAAAAQEAEAK